MTRGSNAFEAMAQIRLATRNIRDDPRFAKADTLQKQGLYDAAHTSLLDLLCEWPGADGKAAILQALSTNRDVAGDLEAAVWYSEKSMTVATRYSALSMYEMGGEEAANRAERSLRPIRVTFLVVAANQYARLGDRQKARDKVSEAQAMLADLQNDRDGRSLLEKGPPLSLTYVQMAIVYILLGDRDESRQMLQKWEAATARPSGQRIPRSVGLSLLASAYAQAGEYAEAKKWAEELLKAPPDQFSEIRQSVVPSILARASIAEGNGPAALKYLAETEARIARYQKEGKARDAASDSAIRPDFYGLGRAKTAWAWGQAYALAGQPQEATKKFLEAVEVIENLRGFVGATDRLAFFGKHSGPYHSLVESLLTLEGEGGPIPAWKGLEAGGRSLTEISFYYGEAARARLLSEQIVRSRPGSAVAKLPPEMAQQERDLLDRANAELLGGVPYENSAAYRALQSFVENLRTAYPDYAMLKYPIPVTASQVLVRENEAVLAYSLLDRSVAIWLLQKGQEPRAFRIPISRDRILETIRALRASLGPDSSGKLSAFNSHASDDLYRWLVAEPLKWIPPGAKIIVIPDGALGTIPFELLTVPGADAAIEFASRSYTFSYVPSATVLSHERRYRSVASASSGEAQLLAVGDPVYDETDPRAQKPAVEESGLKAVREAALRDYSEKLRLGVFSRLPWTGREARQVASALKVSVQSPDVRLGADADEHAIKKLDLTRYRYLHFATHGLLAEDVPYLKQPALVLSQVGDLKGEDGFLTMEEVLNLKLDADLTVLSACQTGLGREISGEGVVGLMRAFLYAGSRSVIVTLWPVADESTSVMMGKFYEHVSQGVPAADALARAKQELRTDRDGRFAHPFYWAPFILFGSE